VTLPDPVWAALALESAAVEARGRFHATYATLGQPRFTPAQLMGLLRDGPVAEGPQAVVKLVSDGEATTEVPRQLNDLAAAGRRPEWIPTAEAADAWRECAMARLLLNTVTGKRALLRAADNYLLLGLPFGDFLGVAATGDRRPVAPAAAELRSLLTGQTATPALGSETLFDRQYAVQAPAQEVALLLTAVANVGQVPDRDDVPGLLAEAAQARGSAPVGPTGAVVADWWGAGLALAGLGIGSPAARLALTGFISEVAYAHGHLLRIAQLDEFHWQRARSPVDLVDLYLAGLVAISVRVLRHTGLPSWRVADDFAGLPPLALVSVIVGLQLAEEDGPPDWRRTYGPSRPGPSDRGADDRRRAGARTEQ
jgi:hypothetical protein